MATCSVSRADECVIADFLANSWIRVSRSNIPAPPSTQAARRELTFKTRDGITLKGFSYYFGTMGDGAAEDFVLLLQGNASSAAQLAQTASEITIQAKREVYVYDYRGYSPESTVLPTATSIIGDVKEVVDGLSSGGRRGVIIGMSLGGIFALQALKSSRSGSLRVLLDSVPPKVPWIPFVLKCPSSMDPVGAANPILTRHLGVLYGKDDGWSRDASASQLMDNVNAGGGQVWLVDTKHADLSRAGLDIRIPIYVKFVLGKK